MAASYPIIVPSLVGKPGISFYDMSAGLPAQNALWRRGDILAQVTTGTLTNPNPNGSLATDVPTAAVTIGSTASAGAPAQFYYAFYTYIGSSSIESLPSAEFPVAVAAGTKGTITVPSAGAPSGATDFALYVGLVPGGEWQQVASTALGSAATIPYPLTNSVGLNRAATDASANIAGLALDDFDVTYAPTPPNAAQVSNRSIFGVDMTAPPVGYLEQYEGFFVKAGNQTFEMSLLQPYYTSLLQTTAGLYYSSTYNAFAVDTSQSNKILTIVGKSYGSQNPNYGEPLGNVGDSGARVLVRFNSGYLA